MIWFEAHLTLVVTAVVILATWMLIQQERRSPQSTLAWLLFLMVLPYIAIPAFLAFGFRKRRANGHGAFPAPPASEAAPLDRLLTGYGVALGSDGNALTVLTAGDQARSDLFDLVEGARQTLWITLYALEDDDVGRAFCAALTERARAGVQVWLILDFIGALRRPRAALRELARAGGKIRLYSPVFHSPFGGHINLRNHRKLVIADGAQVWAGGRNVGGHYMGTAASPETWQDLSFRLAGPQVAGFAALFLSDWATAGNEADAPPNPAVPAPAGDYTLRLVPSGPDTPRDPLHDALVYACHAATRRLWIVTPYFLPTDSLAEALAIAARRGIDVRVLLPARSNQRLADLARGSYLRGLERAGCRLVMTTGRMVHAKALLSDDTAFIGSANLDTRSLMLNYELMVMTRDARVIAKLDDWLGTLLAEGREGVPPASKVRRAIEGLFRLGSPIL